VEERKKLYLEVIPFPPNHKNLLKKNKLKKAKSVKVSAKLNSAKRKKTQN
jgi:hypothetical protein